MNRRLITLLAAAALTLAAALASVNPVSAATSRHVEGRVLSIDHTGRSFRLLDSERGTYRVYVRSSTRFEGTSFTRLRVGHHVEATVRRVSDRWQASSVERRSSSHGSHSRGSDDSSSDDHGGHGSDDGAGHH